MVRPRKVIAEGEPTDIADHSTQVIAIGRQYSVLPPAWYTIIFVIVDVISIAIQASGGGLAASSLADDKESVRRTSLQTAGGDLVSDRKLQTGHWHPHLRGRNRIPARRDDRLLYPCDSVRLPSPTGSHFLPRQPPTFCGWQELEQAEVFGRRGYYHDGHDHLERDI